MDGVSQHSDGTKPTHTVLAAGNNMTDKKDVPIKVGTKQYLLRYGFASLCLIEDTTSKPFLDVFLSLSKLSFNTMKVVFWAGLRTNHPEIALEDVDAILDECNDLPAVIKSLTATLNNFFSKTVQTQEKKVKALPLKTDASAGVN